MNNISLTVPMDKNALTRASEMLQGLASDLGAEPAKVETHPAPSVGASTTSVDDQHIAAPAEPAATEVFAAQQPAEPSPSVFAEQPAEAGNAASEPAASVTEQPADPVQPAAPAESATTAATAPTAAPAGVDLAPSTTNPEVSVPWDARIHAGSKAKLAKKPHGWKMKRGVDAAVVATVEAELIAGVAASPANPVTPAGDGVTDDTAAVQAMAGNAAPAAVEPSATPASPASPAAAPTTAAVAAQPASPAPAPAAQPAAPAGAVTTFPELMAKITSSGIDQEVVTAAVNKQGLQALPLLAARPDLIPAVAAELFPGG